MHSIRLSHLNSSFKVDDKHGHTTLLISSLVIKPHQPDENLPSLRLQVIDQKELVLFSTLISIGKEAAGPEIAINQLFAIFNYLKVEVIATEPGVNYEVDVHYSLRPNAEDIKNK